VSVTSLTDFFQGKTVGFADLSRKKRPERVIAQGRRW